MDEAVWTDLAMDADEATWVDEDVQNAITSTRIVYTYSALKEMYDDFIVDTKHTPAIFTKTHL